VFNPLNEIGARINRTMRAMVLAAAAGAAGVSALFFLSLGSFLWLQQEYGTINASLALGGGYAFIALIALVAVLVLTHAPQPAHEARPAAPPAQAQWWADPVLLSTGLQVLRSLGRRRTLPLAIAAIVAGFVFGDSVLQRQKRPPPPRAKPNGRGTFPDARN